MGDKAVGQPVKMGGRVVDGSVQWDRPANRVAFSVTDGTQIIPVAYSGVVPDTFQEGVDIILEGKMGTDGTFTANSMLAKCASKYEPACEGWASLPHTRECVSPLHLISFRDAGGCCPTRSPEES